MSAWFGLFIMSQQHSRESVGLSRCLRQPPPAGAETHAWKAFLQPMGFPLQPSGKKTIPTKTSIASQEPAIIYRHQAAQIHAEKSNIPPPQEETLPTELEVMVVGGGFCAKIQPFTKPTG